MNTVELRFTDWEKLFIDGAVYQVGFEDALERLNIGDTMELLIHPNSDDIWQITCAEEKILTFSDAKERMRSDNIFFTVLGVSGYAMALLGAVSILVRWHKKRKLKAG